MRKIWNKGYRIRASDKHLVYHYCGDVSYPSPKKIRQELRLC